MLTPQLPYPDLATALGLSTELHLKREDLSPSGSHKGRSIAVMMDAYRDHGIHQFTISSSGNAAIVAADNLLLNESLIIFVGKKIDPKKLKKIQTIGAAKPHIRIEQLDRPKQAAIQYRGQTGAVNLRQSTDDLALAGYESLAKELNQIPNLQAVFIPTSSGTTAQSLGEWFASNNPKVQIHIVQTESCHPIAEYFDKKFTRRSESVARAIVDNIAHRKEKVVAIIEKSNGSGWIASDEEIEDAIKLAKAKTDTDISPNSALSIAGLQKAIHNGWEFSGAVVCLITGV
ncbi:MAG: PLP-dependent lyase/thiolase [Patescibacteria group bacterium]